MLPLQSKLPCLHYAWQALAAGICSLQRLLPRGLRHAWCCLRADRQMQANFWGSVLIFWYV